MGGIWRVVGFNGEKEGVGVAVGWGDRLCVLLMLLMTMTIYAMGGLCGFARD